MIDTTTGMFSQTAFLSGDWPGFTGTVASAVTGMTCDPTGPTMYICNSTTLFSLDVTTGATTLVDDFAGPPLAAPPDFVVAMACNAAGQLYVRSSGDETLWECDKTDAVCDNGVVHTYASINFFQGMDFDPTTDTLYDAIYTGGGTGAWVSWDLGGGTTTEIVTNADFPADTDGYTWLPAIREGAGVVTVGPDTLDVAPGILNAGGIPELLESDNQKLAIFRDSGSVNAVCQFTIVGTSPTTSPTTFDFKLEGSCFSRGNVVQRLELFDYVLQQWETVDEQNANRSPNPDLAIVVSPGGDLSRFVDQTTNEIQARVRYRADVPRAQFAANTDQAVWCIE